MNTTPVTCPICGEEIHSGNCTHSRQDFIREIERLKTYCDKLAAGYPDGMLPTDIQVIKDANWTFAQQVFEQAAEIERLRNDLGLYQGVKCGCSSGTVARPPILGDWTGGDVEDGGK